MRGKASGAGEASVPPALSASEGETVDASVASLSGLNLDQLRLQWRNQLGGIAPAHLPGWLLMRVLAYRIQAAAFGDLDRTILAASERRRPRVGGRPSLCAPRADNARGRRAQVRSSAGPGVERPAGASHGPRRWVRLERLRLPQPFAGRQGDHRHELEWASLLRAEGGEERRSQQKEERHARTEPIARYWHDTNPRRVRARNARWFAASRNEAVRFDISERIGSATELRGRAHGPSGRPAQGHAFRAQRVPATSSIRPGGPTMKRDERKIALRCAVYTRVSTDSGLEQDFNSLDNQREASEAYIKSQAHEGSTIPHLIREHGRNGRWSGRISAAAAGRGGYEASMLALWL